MLLGLLILLGTGQLGCNRSPVTGDGMGEGERDKQRVTLELNWFPEAEHGGYYAALVHGYYADEGLEVTIVPGGPNVPVMQNVARGKSDFGINNADQLLFARDAGADLVALLAPLQDSPRCIMVHADSGIRHFEDLHNMILSVGSSSAFFRFVAQQVPLEGVEIVAYSGSIAPFLTQPRYAQQAYVFSEPFLARQAGVAVHCLMVSELGYNPYTSLLLTSRKYLERQPDRVARMVRATRQGWQKYLEAPAETNAYIAQVNPEMSLEALAFGAEEIAKLCLPGDLSSADLGTMSPERWETMWKQMVDADLLTGDRKLADGAFVTEFLEETLP
jgi:NitT/TauT family transport system substrate-binding protein